MTFTVERPSYLKSTSQQNALEGFSGKNAASVVVMSLYGQYTYISKDLST